MAQREQLGACLWRTGLTERLQGSRYEPLNDQVASLTNLNNASSSEFLFGIAKGLRICV